MIISELFKLAALNVYMVSLPVAPFCKAEFFYSRYLFHLYFSLIRPFLLKRSQKANICPAHSSELATLEANLCTSL